MNTSTVAAATVVCLGGILLALVIRVFLRWVEGSRFRRRTVTLLLPGVKRLFIPCEEGIYTRQFKNPYTGSRWYRLRPWGSVELDTLDPQRSRIAMRDGKTMMYLRARPGAGDGTVGYDDLRNVVMEHLPAGKQMPQHKPLKFGWISLAVCRSVAWRSLYQESRQLRRIRDSSTLWWIARQWSRL